MKTFKWTLPEPELSKIEKHLHRLKGDTISDDPTRNQIKNHLRWEKISKKGIRRHIILTTIGILSALAVLMVLDHYEIIEYRSYIPGFIGGLVGALIGEIRGWNKYNELRDKISRYLNETNKTEQDDEGN